MFPYLGSKRRQKKVILDTLDDVEFDVFIDVFGGSAFVCSLIDENKTIIYNDKNSTVMETVKDLCTNQELIEKLKNCDLRDFNTDDLRLNFLIKTYTFIRLTMKNQHEPKIDSFKARLNKNFKVKKIKIDEFWAEDFVTFIPKMLNQFKDKKILFYIDNPYIGTSEYDGLDSFLFKDVIKLYELINLIDKKGQLFFWQNDYTAYARENFTKDFKFKAQEVNYNTVAVKKSLKKYPNYQLLIYNF